jgi:hypothetical protein
MLAAVGAAIVIGQSIAAFGDDVPTFDLTKTCKTDVQAYQGSAGGQASDTSCVNDEKNARATLVSQWTEFSTTSRQGCVRLQGDAAAPRSYVELLTCLQVAKEVKGLPKN